MTARTGLAWYVDRLRVMSAQEVLHRLREQLQLRALARSQSRVRRAREHQFAFCTAAQPMLPPMEWDTRALECDAAELLAGRSTALGVPWQWSPDADCWHRAPDTGAIWPAVYFTRIAYRQGNPYGDARRVWEPSRLQQLVGLALLAGNEQHRSRALAVLQQQLGSWIAANPAYIGPHYVSAMECALRLIAVCHAVDLARDTCVRNVELMAGVATLVESHAQLLLRRPSLHSSAGNHTLAEAVGLLYAGYLFPELNISRRCRSLGTRLLHDECARQILLDGGGLEQTTGYLRFIVDLVCLASALLKKHGKDVRELDSRIDRACAFLHTLGPFGTSGPGIGDADDSQALSAYARLRSPPRGAARPLTTFAESGYSVLRGPQSTHLVFDHGPLGMPPLYAHGHADCLSLLVARNSQPLLIDPGTYTYTGGLTWRSHFRSTRAHNTVTVDGQDQAAQRGAFAWDLPFRASTQLSGGPSGSALLGTHDGYRRLGVQHWRGVIYDHAERILVWDYLRGDGDHRIEVWWHLGVAVTQVGSVVRANAGERFICLALLGTSAVELHRGSEAPIAGWRAPRYGVKEPASSVCAAHLGALPHEMITLIALSPRATRLIPDGRELAQIHTFRRLIDAR